MRDPRSIDPTTERLLQRAAALRSPALQATVQRVITRRHEALTARAAASGHAAWPILPDPVPCVRPWPMGLLPSGRPWMMDLAQHGGLVVIIGLPGSGKSLLSNRLANAAYQAGITTILVDTRHDPSFVMPVPFPMLTPEQAALSTAPPPGIAADRWLAVLQWLIEASTYVHAGSVHIQETIRALAEEYPEQEVCYAAVADRLQRHLLHASRWSPTLTHIESAVVALRRLCDGHPLLRGSPMLPWRQRLGQSHGYYLVNATAEAARVCAMAWPMAWTLTQQTLGRDDRRTRAILIADDARVVVKATQRTGQSAVDPLQHLIDTSQSSGLLIWVNVQSPAELGESLWGDAHTVILVGPQDGSVLHTLRHRLRLTDDQAHWLREQPVGSAVVQSRLLPFAAPFPVRLHGPEILPSPEPCRIAQQDGLARLMAGATIGLWSPTTLAASSPRPPARSSTRSSSASSALPPAAPPVASPSPASTAFSPTTTLPPATPIPPAPLDPVHHRLLTTLASVPHALQSELGIIAGIQGRELTSVRELLVQRSLLRVHRFLRYTLLELTQSGAALIGLVYQPLSGRGDYPHRWCQLRIAASLTVTHARVTIEQQTIDGAVDIAAQTADGATLWVEVVLSPDTLNRALTKLSALPGEGWLIVPDSPTAQRVNARPLLHQRLTVQTVAEMIASTRPGKIPS